MDLTVMDGFLDRATGLVSVRAVWEPAMRNIGTELDEVALELAWNDSPELELPEPRRIDHVASFPQLDQFGGRRGVLALERPLRHLANFQVQSRLDHVQERALAHAALAGDRGQPLREQGPELVDP